MTDTSYLEFGSEAKDSKKIYDKRHGQEAYEFFMAARYLKDIIGYRTNDLTKIHHKEDLSDNQKKYAALKTCFREGNELKYYEIGSSLMGVIDSLNYLNRIHKELKVKDILFIGIDNSDMMNKSAKYLHEHYKLALFSDIALLECDLFFAKGVSLLYAIDNEDLFCSVLNRAKIAIFDYTFSNDKKIIERIGTGKEVCFLSLKECKKKLNKELILNPSTRISERKNDRETFECIYGEKEAIKEYLKNLKRYLR